MTELVVTKIAERGKKFDETGQCISSHNYSIVFLPRGVKPGELVRIRLMSVKDDQGVEKKDARGAVMYRTEWALPKIPNSFKAVVSEEARLLRLCGALPKKEGEAALRVMRGSASVSGPGFDWYYFADDGNVYGSLFSPSALLLFEAFPNASEGGLVELVAWLIDPIYYARRQSGQGIHFSQVPDLSDEKIESLKKSASGLLLWKPILSQLLT